MTSEWWLQTLSPTQTRSHSQASVPCLSMWEGTEPCSMVIEGDLRSGTPSLTHMQRPILTETQIQILTSLTQPHRPVPHQDHQSGLTQSFPGLVRTWAL